jgi:cob(I)alamin adenosyltransferase
MRIYTRTGDHGETGLFGNHRVPKEDLRVEAYGTVDELNSFLGLIRAEPLPRTLDARMKEIQDTLFELGSDLATVDGKASLPRVVPGITEMEHWMDETDSELPPLRTFVLPAGTRAAALLHVARTVARRAERVVWHLHRRDRIPTEIGTYLNRLSDLLFVWARLANARAGVADVPWVARRS